MGAGAFRRMYVAWHREHLAVLFRRQPGRNQRPAFLCGLDDDGSQGYAADDSVADGKMVRVGTRLEGKLGDHRPGFGDVVKKMPIDLRIDPLKTRSEHGDGFPRRRKSPPVGGGIDSSRQSADDRYAGSRHFRTESFSRGTAVGGSAARSNDGDVSQAVSQLSVNV